MKVEELLKKINQDSTDIVNVVVAILTVVLNIVTQQKGENTVVTNGNNNEVQIPNEAGPGSNVQV